MRFLPAFDKAILGRQDRGRIIDTAHLGLSVTGHRTELDDGRVSATWTVRGERLGISPLRPLTAADTEAVCAEARELAAFLDEGAEEVRLQIAE